MDPVFLFHVPFGLTSFSVWGCPNEAQNRYAQAICFSRVVWRTVVKVSGHGGVIIMINIKEMTVESGE